MRILSLTLGIFAAAVVSAAPVVATKSGSLQGVHRDPVDVFLGVPYAEPPVGALRWRAPVAVKAWSGVRNATEFGASCYQGWPARQFGPYTAEFVDTPRHAEDCLFLNIWAPARSSAKAPVMVWIHGGGFGGGSGALSIYDGSHFAAQGIVVVTINYRVGPFGFLAHPELTREAHGTGVGNYGLQDMIEALRWVRGNIEAFGGDPARVTIMGQSAGAMAVNDLIVSPLAKGLFARAIAQSGSGMGIPSIPLARPSATARSSRKQRVWPRSLSCARCRRRKSRPPIRFISGRRLPVLRRVSSCDLCSMVSCCRSIRSLRV